MNAAIFIFQVFLSNLLKTSSFPSKIPDEGYVFPTDFERSKNFDFRNSRWMNRKDFFDTDTLDILANDDIFIEFGFPMSFDHKSPELLDTLLASFFDNLVNFNLHTGTDLRSLILDGILLDSLYKLCVHIYKVNR